MSTTEIGETIVLKEVKKHISLEKPHIMPELSKEELAGWVQALFFQDQTNELEEVETYILRKEIAFQAIKTILNGSEPRSVTVKNEKDWIRYFDLENRNQSEAVENEPLRRREENVKFAKGLHRTPSIELLAILDSMIKRKAIEQCGKKEMLEKYALFKAVESISKELDEEARNANKELLKVMITNQSTWDRHLTIPPV